MKSNLGLLKNACNKLLQNSDFWALGGLSDWSFEEGDRNVNMRKVIESYGEFGVKDKELLRRLSDGVNGCMKEILEKENPDICPVTRNKGKGQDLSWASSDSYARTEVKSLYDCIYKKYYLQVAEDYSKLEKVRAGGFGGDLFLVVTFVELPEYKYPIGGPLGPRKVVFCGIDAQLTELSRSLTVPFVWRAGKQSLTLPSREIVDAMERRFHAVFEKPFKVEPALKGGRIDAAIWQVP